MLATRSSLAMLAMLALLARGGGGIPVYHDLAMGAGFRSIGPASDSLDQCFLGVQAGERPPLEVLLRPV